MDLDLQQLISDPIIALNKAESENSKAFVELLLAQAFEKPDKDGISRLKTLQFSFDKTSENGEREVHEISVPLLHFFPIGGLNVEQARLKYALNIEHSQAKSGGRPVLKGRIANAEKGAAGTTGNIQIELDLRQVDLPKGIIDALEYTHGGTYKIRTLSNEAIQPKPPNVEDIVVPEQLFEAVLIDVKPKRLEAGQTHTARIKITPNKILVQNEILLAITAKAYPDKSLVDIELSNHTLKNTETIEVRFDVHPKIERYKPNTPVNIVLLAQAQTANAGSKHYQLKIPMPRQLQKTQKTKRITKNEPRKKIRKD